MASDSGDDLVTSRQLLPDRWEARPGLRISRFTLRKKLGSGGQGQAWLAADPNRQGETVEGLVVLKFLPPEVCRDANRMAEFRAAYVAAQAVHHEAICPLFDLGQDPVVGLFQVMLYQPGITLRQLLIDRGAEARGLPASEVLDLLDPIARALDHVHSESVVHCDVKPENIIWDPQRRRIHLIDFGLAARSSADRGHLPDSQVAPGTLRYRSPEIWQGLRPDPADDRWALAVTAWELLYGLPPFDAGGWELRDQVCAGEPRTVVDMSPAVRGEFLAAFAPAPATRPASCTAFVQRLREAVETSSRGSTNTAAISLEFPCSPRRAELIRDRCAEVLRLPGQVDFPWGRLSLIPPGWALCGNPRSTAETQRALAEFCPEERILRLEFPAVRQQFDQPLYFAVAPVSICQFERFLAETGHRVESERDGMGGWGFDAVRQTFHGPVPEFSWRETGWPQSPGHPVVNVSWNDAHAFADACNRFSSLIPGKRLRFRLPTEWEWEYASRAGSPHDFWFGPDPAELGRCGNVTDATKRRAWPAWKGLNFETGFRFTSPVDSFPPNPFGLCDMQGNVRQWCQDKVTANGSSRYAGQPCRVIRGGAWCNSPVHARCSARDYRPESHRDDHIGIRVVAEIRD